jgi:hypothetical protein
MFSITPTVLEGDPPVVVGETVAVTVAGIVM